jgi:hypothetical protein
MIGVAMGVNNIRELFEPKYYLELEGGILEAFGRLFRNSVKLYEGFNPDVLHIYSRDVLKKIAAHDGSWEGQVPAAVAQGIKRRGLFGYGG